jgi:hydroxypyruvate isomerase
MTLQKKQLAPHIGLNAPDDFMFPHLAGKNAVDQIAFAAEQGFGGIEDNFFKLREIDEQKAIAKALEKHDMQLGASVFNLHSWATASFVTPIAEAREMLKQDIATSIEASKLNGAKVLTTLSGPGFPALPDAIQVMNIVDNLRWLGDEMAKHNLTLGLEAITSRGWPTIFLNSPRQALQIVKAVNHPNVKLIYDIFHVQVEDGDVLRGIDEAWDQIALIQMADVPTRTEPGSGELNFANILKKIDEKGYTGLIEMEHGHSKDGVEGEKHSLDVWNTLIHD